MGIDLPAAVDDTAPRHDRGGSGVRPGVAVEEPACSDAFVRGLSEAIGGPLGEHAVRPAQPVAESAVSSTFTSMFGSVFGASRFWTPVRIVLALTCLTLALHWVQKSPCRDGAWSDLSQYKYFCYTDVMALYHAEGLAEGAVPYADHAVEYPVLTGAAMGVLGLPVHWLGTHVFTTMNQAKVFYDLNTIVLGGFALAAVGVILALRRRRPWDAALFALAPALFVTATVNWDLLAVGLAALAMYAWARRHPIVAGILLGLAVSAKFYPLLLFGPLLVLAVRTGRRWPVLQTAAAGAITWVTLNLPVFLLYPSSWLEFWRLNSSRGIDWGTSWYIGEHWPFGGDQYGLSWFQELNAQASHSRLNTLYLGLFILACVAIAALGLAAPRKPRLAQLAFLVVAAFLITGKVWSQQYVLWLLPLAVLARPRWGAFLAWQVSEVLYFLAFYGELMGASGRAVFPEWVFVTASALRLVTLGVLMGLVVYEILRPDRDVVRQTYVDDPDGGVFDGAPDDGLVLRFGRRALVS